MEVHSGLGVERGSKVSDLKKKLKCELIQNNFSNLQELSRKLKSIQRTTFRKKYGNLLELLELDIEMDIVTALAQYYDSSMRCFLFQDFQLVPTIEEYEQSWICLWMGESLIGTMSSILLFCLYHLSPKSPRIC